MLAEDDPTMASLLKTLLKLEGFEVSEVSADSDVLAEARKQKPDALLMDVHLGNQNGLEVLRRLRQSSDLANLRVVMSSGASVKDECMSAGADAFLLKPYMPDDLIALLKKSLVS